MGNLVNYVAKPCQGSKHTNTNCLSLSKTDTKHKHPNKITKIQIWEKGWFPVDVTTENKTVAQISLLEDNSENVFVNDNDDESTDENSTTSDDNERSFSGNVAFLGPGAVVGRWLGKKLGKKFVWDGEAGWG